MPSKLEAWLAWANAFLHVRGKGGRLMIYGVIPEAGWQAAVAVHQRRLLLSASASSARREGRAARFPRWIVVKPPLAFENHLRRRWLSSTITEGRQGTKVVVRCGWVTGAVLRSPISMPTVRATINAFSSWQLGLPDSSSTMKRSPVCRSERKARLGSSRNLCVFPERRRRNRVRT